MRNYVQQFWSKITYDVDVNPPNPPVPEVGYVMSPSLLQLITDVDAFVADLQTDPRKINIQPITMGPLYWLLDKTNLNLILQFAATQAMQIIDQFNSYPNYIYSGPANTPRKGWTDNDGIKRLPPPSEKPRAGTKSKTGVQDMSLFAYLVRLRDTWQSGATGTVPQRWIEWLSLLISHYSRYSPTQIYGFLARVDFSSKTFRV